MAQSLHIPGLFMRGTRLTTQCIHRRPFSCIPALYAAPKPIMPMSARSPAMAKVVQDQLEVQRIRDDFGMLPETFIMPTGSNRPPIISKDLYKLLQIRLVSHVKDFLTILYIKYMVIKPRPIINFRATKSVAIGLQRQMYQAFAAGSTDTIRQICAEGLCETMLRRIHNRKPGETLKWEMVREKGARVVSHRATPLAVENSGLRQAVVRIRSVQRLTRFDREGNVVAGSGREKEVVEYVVIQKKTWEGREGSWKVWGTTKESSLREIERAKREEMERLTSPS